MNRYTVLGLALALAAAAALPVSAGAAERGDGLAAVQTMRFDELAVRPDTNLGSYRKVLIEPVRVEFQKDWKRNINDSLDLSHRIDDGDVQRIRTDMASNATALMSEVFRAHGYTVVSAPEEGTLRLSPKVTELYVNAPDIVVPGRTRTFAREAGDATFVLEVRDASSNTLLARSVYRKTAQMMGKLNVSSDTSNQFWFDAAVRRWADASADELTTGKSVATVR
jgi:hypothetical protein